MSKLLIKWSTISKGQITSYLLSHSYKTVSRRHQPKPPGCCRLPEGWYAEHNPGHSYGRPGLDGALGCEFRDVTEDPLKPRHLILSYLCGVNAKLRATAWKPGDSSSSLLLRALGFRLHLHITLGYCHHSGYEADTKVCPGQDEMLHMHVSSLKELHLSPWSQAPLSQRLPHPALLALFLLFSPNSHHTNNS